MQMINLKSSKKQPEARLTDVKVQSIDQETVKNIVMYGDPLGLQMPLQNGKMGHQLGEGEHGESYQETWIEK